MAAGLALAWLAAACALAGAAAAPAGATPPAAQVRALAQRLEQWLACARSPRLGRAEVAPGCGPHFDGHLCWPATRAGQRAARACPRTAVINSSQSLSALGAGAAGLGPGRGRGGGPAEATGAKAAPAGPGGSSAPLEQVFLATRACQAGARWAAGADYSACGPAAAEPADEPGLFQALTDELAASLEAAIDPYADPDLLQQWTQCIGNIMRARLQPPAAPAHLSCPVVFDGWRCWPATEAGQIAYVSCPAGQAGFSAERKAYKVCTADGTWYRHPQTNRSWSNYTTCVDTVDLAFRTKILDLYVIGNLISLVALLASLIVFISFKSLNCTRVTIHKNLFLSFITNNLMWIIWYTYVVNDASLLQSNPIGCQFWHILLHYFLVSNYFWMFCEGLYLHTLLVVAFVSEDKILKWFYLLGWLMPLPITLAYAYNRAHDDSYTHFCWMEESPYNMILMMPIGISLLLNLVFLINIVRVLVTKLRANNAQDTHQTRKAVRATLILIPLLGLHYMLTPFRPDSKSEWEFAYEIVAAICTSFQGLCVALLFCFCNAEVVSALKKKLKDTFSLRALVRARQGPQAGRAHQAGKALLASARRSTVTSTVGPIGGSHGSGGLAFGQAAGNGASSPCGSLQTTLTAGSPVAEPLAARSATTSFSLA